MIYESIVNRRTIRKFNQKIIPPEVLRKCVNAARLSPSGMNLQYLKYIIVNDKNLLPRIFNSINSWARGIPNYYHTPNDVPTAYIIILLDTKIREEPGIDPGIASMSISMVAYEEGIGSCIIGSADKTKLKEILKVPNHLQILLVIAMGYPSEKATVDDMKEDDKQYWRDENMVIHVPKRKLEDIAFWNSF